MAVVVQKCSQSEISGIAFTVHPVTEDPDQMIIEAGYGWARRLFPGKLRRIVILLPKSDLGILDINIGAQTQKLTKSKIRKSIKSKSRNKVEDNGVNAWVKLGAKGRSRNFRASKL